MNYKIIAVSSNVKDYQSKYGAMKEYKIKLEGEDQAIQLNQKAETPAPTEGQELNGTIDYASEFGPKFNKDYSPAPRSSGGGGYTDHHESIKAEWAIGQAIVALNTGKGTPDIEAIKALAKDLHTMVDEIKSDEVVDVTGDEDVQKSLDDIGF